MRKKIAQEKNQQENANAEAPQKDIATLPTTMDHITEEDSELS